MIEEEIAVLWAILETSPLGQLRSHEGQLAAKRCRKKTALAGALITPEPPAIPSAGRRPRPFEFVSVVPLGGDVPIISARGNRSKSFPAPLYLKHPKLSSNGMLP